MNRKARVENRPEDWYRIVLRFVETRMAADRLSRLDLAAERVNQAAKAVNQLGTSHCSPRFAITDSGAMTVRGRTPRDELAAATQSLHRIKKGSAPFLPYRFLRDLDVFIAIAELPFRVKQLKTALKEKQTLQRRDQLESELAHLRSEEREIWQPQYATALLLYFHHTTVLLLYDHLRKKYHARFDQRVLDHLKRASLVDQRVIDYLERARLRYMADPKRNVRKALGLVRSAPGKPRGKLSPDEEYEAVQMVTKRSSGTKHADAVEEVAHFFKVSDRTIRSLTTKLPLDSGLDQLLKGDAKADEDLAMGSFDEWIRGQKARFVGRAAATKKRE